MLLKHLSSYSTAMCIEVLLPKMWQSISCRWEVQNNCFLSASTQSLLIFLSLFPPSTSSPTLTPYLNGAYFKPWAFLFSILLFPFFLWGGGVRTHRCETTVHPKLLPMAWSSLSPGAGHVQEVVPCPIAATWIWAPAHTGPIAALLLSQYPPSALLAVLRCDKLYSLYVDHSSSALSGAS